jgi:hypothetical protein
VPIKVDDDGVGGAVTDILRADGFNVVPVSSATAAYEQDGYPNKRSELWFATAERTREDGLDLSGLARNPKEPTQILTEHDGNPVRLIDEDTLDELKRQFMAATYSLDSRARRVVCPKDEQKQKLGRSPDGADAINLGYHEPPEATVALPEIIYRRHNPLLERRLPKK